MEKIKSLNCEGCGMRYFDDKNILNILTYDMCCNCMEMLAFDNADDDFPDKVEK